MAIRLNPISLWSSHAAVPMYVGAPQPRPAGCDAPARPPASPCAGCELRLEILAELEEQHFLVAG